MGNINTIEGNSVFKEQDLSLLETALVAGFGELNVYKHIPKNILIISIPKNFKDTSYMDRCLLSHPNVLATLGYKYGWRELLGVQNDSQEIFLEYCKFSLNSIVEKRRVERNQFPENELILMLKDVSSALAYLFENNTSHGALCMNTIFYDYNTDKYKIYDHSLILGSNAAFELAKSRQLLCYHIAPELLAEFTNPEKAILSKRLNLSKEQSHKADIFALGMVALEAATLCRLDFCYDLINSKFNFQALNEKLVMLEQNFSFDFVCLIKEMLIPDADIRPDVFSLWEKFFLINGRQSEASTLNPVVPNEGEISTRSRSKSADRKIIKEVVRSPSRIPRRGTSPLSAKPSPSTPRDTLMSTPLSSRLTMSEMNQSNIALPVISPQASIIRGPSIMMIHSRENSRNLSRPNIKPRETLFNQIDQNVRQEVQFSYIENKHANMSKLSLEIKNDNTNFLIGPSFIQNISNSIQKNENSYDFKKITLSPKSRNNYSYKKDLTNLSPKGYINYAPPIQNPTRAKNNPIKTETINYNLPIHKPYKPLYFDKRNEMDEVEVKAPKVQIQGDAVIIRNPNREWFIKSASNKKGSGVVDSVIPKEKMEYDNDTNARIMLKFPNPDDTKEGSHSNTEQNFYPFTIKTEESSEKKDVYNSPSNKSHLTNFKTVESGNKSATAFTSSEASLALTKNKTSTDRKLPPLVSPRNLKGDSELSMNAPPTFQALSFNKQNQQNIFFQQEQQQEPQIQPFQPFQTQNIESKAQNQQPVQQSQGNFYPMINNNVLDIPLYSQQLDNAPPSYQGPSKLQAGLILQSQNSGQTFPENVNRVMPTGGSLPTNIVQSIHVAAPTTNALFNPLPQHSRVPSSGLLKKQLMTERSVNIQHTRGSSNKGLQLLTPMDEMF